MKHANTFRDPLHDGAAFTKLKSLQDPNFNIESIKSDFIKSDNVNRQV